MKIGVLICGFVLLLLAGNVHAQQDIKVDVKPTIVKYIDGVSDLDRSKYFNLAADSKGMVGKTTSEQLDHYLNEYEMTMGRRLGLVFSETRWGDSFREDTNRPGFVDTTYLASKKNPDDNGLAEIKKVYGENEGLVTHDRANAFPDWMDKYTKDDGDTYFPTNNDAAAEMIAHLNKHGFTDFQRAKYYELVNEPHWQFWSDQRFYDFHTKTKAKFDEMNIPTEVGGPCYSVGYFYRNKFKLSSITDFIDGTNFKLDFYSFHIYDYMKWNDSKNDFVGTVSTGLPEEAVFDALAAYTHNKYGKSFSFVGSEHGGYVSDGSLETAENKMANQYFPGSGFEHEMEKRSISNFIMVNSAIANTMMFMNHPHVVKKAVPFILLESASWDTRYYSSLLVKENFDKNAPNYVQSKLIHFYDFFKGIKGRRVDSYCDDNDIQHHAFADGNKLMLLFHNQSNENGLIDLKLNSETSEIESMTIRRVGRQVDFRPYFSEESLTTVEDIEIKGQESVVVFVNYKKSIEVEKKLNYQPYYSYQTSHQFSGSADFQIQIPGADDVVAAELRVGIGREADDSKEVLIKVNGTTVNIPIEDSAERLTADKGYGTMRGAKIDPSILKVNNVVTVSFTDGRVGGVGAVVIRAAKNRIDAVQSVEVQDSLKMYQGQKKKLNFKVLPEEADNKEVVWKSLDETVAMVANGVVQGVKPGQINVVLTSVDGSFTDTCVVVVESFKYESILPKSQIKAIYVDDEGATKGMLKELAVDGDVNTYWHTEWIPSHNPLPHEIWIDLGDTISFNEFVMTPRQDQWGPNGTIGDYELYVSNDTSNWGMPMLKSAFVWDSLGQGEFYYQEVKHVDFDEVETRFFRLLALTEHQNNPSVTTTCVAEMDFKSEVEGLEIPVDLSIENRTVFKIDSVKILPLGNYYSSDLFNWNSLNENIATVEAGGITCISEGVAKIVVESFGSDYVDTCLVEVVVPKHEVNFEIVDRGDIKMDGAVISFGDQNYTADGIGKLSLGDVIEGTYNIQVEKSGRQPYSSSVDIVSDTTLIIVLDYISVVKANKSTELKIYPNPVSQTLNVVASEKGEAMLYALDGKLIQTVVLAEGNNIWDISNVKQGAYIVRVKQKNSLSSRIITINR